MKREITKQFADLTVSLSFDSEKAIVPEMEDAAIIEKWLNEMMDYVSAGLRYSGDTAALQVFADTKIAMKAEQ